MLVPQITGEPRYGPSIENWSVLQSPSAPPLVVLTDVAVAVDVPNTGSEISKLSKSNLKVCFGGFEIFALFFHALSM